MDYSAAYDEAFNGKTEDKQAPDVGSSEYANAYDDAFGNSVDTQFKAGINVKKSFGINPDTAAEVNDLANKYGLPNEAITVDDGLTKFKHKAAYDSVSPLIQGNTKLQAFLADPQNASISHDDLFTLDSISKKVDRSYLGASLVAGGHDLAGAVGTIVDSLLGVAGLTTNDAELATLYKNDPEKLKAIREHGIGTVFSRYAREQEEAAKRVMSEVSPEQQAKYGDLKYATTDPTDAAYLSPVKVASDVARSAPATAAMLASVLLTRGAAANAYKDSIAAGATAAEARDVAIKAGAETMAKASAISEGAIGYAEQYNQTRGANDETLSKVADSTIDQYPNYKAMIDQGYDPEAAKVFLSHISGEQAGVGAGAADALINLIGGKYLGKAISEGGSVLTRLGKGFLTEGIEESAQSPLEQIASNIATQQTVDSKQGTFDGALESMVQGFVVGGVSGGAMTAALGRSSKDIADTAKAHETQNLIKTLNQLGEQSKLKQRSPETLERFVNEASGDADIYVSAEAFNQAGLVYMAAKLSPAVAQQVQVAYATGADIRIPMGEFVAKLSGTPIADFLAEHGKTDPNAMTFAEAQEAAKAHESELMAEIGRVMDEAQLANEHKESAKQVYDHVLEQLDSVETNYDKSANKAMAQLHQAYATVRGSQLGMKPMDFYNQHLLKVTGNDVGGLNQRTEETTTAYNNRIDELFSGHAVNREGAKVLDRADMLDMLGYGDKPLILKESKVRDGIANHPNMTADVWKKIPEWIDNPAAIFDSHTVKGRLVFVSPEMLGDNVVSVVIEPNDKQGHYDVGLLLNAYDRSAKDIVNWTNEGLLKYLDKEKTQNLLNTSRLQLPRVNQGAGFKKILTEKNLNGYRKGKNNSANGVNKLDQILRGQFSPSTNTIALLKDADLSTFLHESAHYFFAIDMAIAADLANKPNLTEGEKQIVADSNALLDWFGFHGTAGEKLALWHSLSLDEQRKYHEQVAESFERYLFSGEAPSIELQPVFQRFRSWMIRVYKSIKDFLAGHPDAGKLNDDVKAVFDRMLATNEQIDNAQQARSLMPLLTDPKGLMSEKEFAEYQALGMFGTADAIDRLQSDSLKNMQWIENKIAAIKKLTNEAKALRRDIYKEAKDIILQEPVYRAWYALTGRMEDETGDGAQDKVYLKFNRESLEKNFSDADLSTINHYWMAKIGGGTDPDIIADMFGFTSGYALIDALNKAEKPSKAINDLTDKMMIERYGELSTPEAIKEAADRSVHNDMMIRMVTTEANALNRSIGQRQILRDAVKLMTDNIISKTLIRNIRPSQFANQAANAAKNAQRAFTKGDIALSAAEKRNQLLAMELTKASYDAKSDFEKGLKYLKRIAKSDSKITADDHDRILAILDLFNLRMTNKQADNQARFSTWVKAQLKMGEIPPNFELLLSTSARVELEKELQSVDDNDELIYSDDDARAELVASYLDRAQVRSVRNLTVEEFRDLVDTVKHIEHIGRRKKRVLTDRRKREFAEVITEIKQNAEEVANKSGRKDKFIRSSNSNLGRAKEMAFGFGNAHIKAAALVEVIDGKQNGPLWDALTRSSNEASDKETLDLANLHDEYDALLRTLKKNVGDITDRAKPFNTIGMSLNRNARLSMALNMGNESNIQRLLGGNKWTIEQIQPVLATLTKAEWDFVQGVWDLYEKYKPSWESVYRDINGSSPDMITPKALTVKTLDGFKLNLRGGYAPVVYDPRGSGRAQSHADEKLAKESLSAARLASTVQKGFTKSRVDEVHGRPLLLSLDALMGGIQDTIHFTHWQPWIIDANRIIKALDSTLRPKYGSDAMNVLREWVSETAAGVQAPRDNAERMIAYLSKNVSFTLLAFNVSNALQQLTGFSPSISTLGTGGSVASGYKWMGKGIAHVLKDRKSAYQEAISKSIFMRKRASTMLRDINENMHLVQDQSKARELMERYGYSLMQTVQVAVDLPTWWGAYAKAVETQGGVTVHGDGRIDDSLAVSLADQAVIDSQGNGAKKDLSKYERATGAMRLFIGLMSYMNTTLNHNYRITRSDKNIARKAHDFLLVNIMPVIGMIMIKSAITAMVGGGGDDDDNDFAKEVTREGIAFMFSQLVGLREIAHVYAAIEGDNLSGNYGGPVGMKWATDMLKLAKQSGQEELDLPMYKALVSVAGDLFRLPSVQINRMITGANAINEGDTDSPAALLFGYQH